MKFDANYDNILKIRVTLKPKENVWGSNLKNYYFFRKLQSQMFLNKKLSFESLIIFHKFHLDPMF